MSCETDLSTVVEVGIKRAESSVAVSVKLNFSKRSKGGKIEVWDDTKYVPKSLLKLACH